MSQKPDYYSALKLEKTATPEEIKGAYTKAVMRFHPDRMLKKSDAEKAEAQARFQEIEEAYKVLSDTRKREVYDSYGHDGLARLAAGQSVSTGPGYADLAGPSVVRRPASEDELSDFFRSKSDDGSLSLGTHQAVSAQEAAAARRARRENRHNAAPAGPAERIVTGVADVAPPASAKPAAPVAPAARTAGGVDFGAVTKDVRAVQDGLVQVNQGGMAEVPLDTLVRFRDNLQDMLKVVDEAIARTRRNGGPRR